MESKDVQERLTSMTSNISLPTDRKAAIWNNIQKEIAVYERQNSKRRQKTIWYRSLAFTAAAACVAAIMVAVYDRPDTPTTPHFPSPTTAQGKPATIMMFQGQSSSWQGRLSEVSQDAKEVDTLDLNYIGPSIGTPLTVDCVTSSADGSQMTATGQLKDGKVRIQFSQPVQSSGMYDQAHVLVTLKWGGHKDDMPLVFNAAYQTK